VFRLVPLRSLDVKSTLIKVAPSRLLRASMSMLLLQLLQSNPGEGELLQWTACARLVEKLTPQLPRQRLTCEGPKAMSREQRLREGGRTLHVRRQMNQSAFHHGYPSPHRSFHQ
jgi:hypothetical protein